MSFIKLYKWPENSILSPVLTVSVDRVLCLCGIIKYLFYTYTFQNGKTLDKLDSRKTRLK